MHRVTGAIALVLLAGARPSAAQATDPPRLFIEGSALVNIDLRSHAESRNGGLVLGPDDMSSTVPGGAVGVGTYLARNVSLRLEVSMPANAHLTGSASTLLSDDPIFIAAIGTTTTSLAFTDDLRSWTTMVLAGYHSAPTRRVRLAYLGGVAFDRTRDHNVTTQTTSSVPPFIPTRVQTTESTTIQYATKVAVGIDAEIGLASHLAVVPQLRVIAGSAIRITPGVALRWIL